MTRNRTLAIVATVVLFGAIGLYVAYDQVLRGDSVAPLALPAASAGAGATARAAEAPASTSAAAGADATPPATPTGNTGAIAEGSVARTWKVTTGSRAGYRVREQLANLPAESDAVGRTSAVTGSMTLVTAGGGAQLTGGTITVDTTSIASDEQRRDNRMRSEGLQTDQFPTATFTITAPVDIPAAAVAGTPTDVTLTGDLTIHGVTKHVQIPAKARLADGQIQVAGAISFPLSDYGISAPSVGGFIISIADQGAMEFLLAFEPA